MSGSAQRILVWLKSNPGWWNPGMVGFKALHASSPATGFKLAAGPLKKLSRVGVVEVRHPGPQYRAKP